MACNEKRDFSLLNNLKDISCGYVRKFVTFLIISLNNIFYKILLKIV